MLVSTIVKRSERFPIWRATRSSVRGGRRRISRRSSMLVASSRKIARDAKDLSKFLPVPRKKRQRRPILRSELRDRRADARLSDKGRRLFWSIFKESSICSVSNPKHIASSKDLNQPTDKLHPYRLSISSFPRNEEKNVSVASIEPSADKRMTV